jgi:biotin transport system ATP-binding protein
VDAILDRYGLHLLRDHPAHLLSGGEKQLLALSAVLVAEPRYLVFDEPTTMLDLRNKRRITETIRSLEQHVIMISHDLDQLDDFDRVILLHEGKVIEDGPPTAAVLAYQDLMSIC